MGSKLPDRFDSRRTDSLVSGDEGQAQVHGGRRDDPIGHIRDYIAGHFVYRLSHVFIHCLNEEAGSDVFQASLQTVQGFQGQPPSFDKIDGLNGDIDRFAFFHSASNGVQCK